MNKTWFRRLLLSYLPVFFIVTMILFMLFFHIINEQNRSDAMKANEFVAQQVMIYIDGSLKALEHKVLRDIISNQDLRSYFKASNHDAYANIMALKVMDEIKLSHPHIHSIYFARMHDGYVLHDGSVSKMDSFPDQSFILSNFTKPVSARWSGVREYTSFSHLPKDRVVTIAKGYPFQSDKAEGLIVVNVDLKSLAREINKMYSPGTSFIELMDQEGQYLYQNVNLQETSMFSSFSSEYTGWTLESGMDSGGAVKFALTIYNIWIFVALAAVGFGVIWFLLITRRNYKPIQQMINLLQTYSQKSGGAGIQDQNEFSFIQKTLESMLEQSNEYRQQFQENLLDRKKYLFHEVLSRIRHISEEEWAEELTLFRLQVPGKICVVHMVEIDNRKDFIREYNNHDQSLIKFVISSVIQETAHELHAEIWAEWVEEYRLCYIMWFPADAEPQLFSDELCQLYTKWIDENLAFTVTVAQGELAENLEAMQQSYEFALKHMEYKAVLGTNRIIQSEHILDSKTEIRTILKTIFLLIQSLRLSDSDWEKQLDVLFFQIKENLMPRSEIESIVTFLTQHLDRELSELAKEYHDVWIVALDEIIQFSGEWETIYDLKQACHKVLHEMYTNTLKLRESKSNRAMIQDIRAYIEEHYANPNLSLDFLSDIFQLNGKYLSKMFKDEFGENFVDFLIGLRINNAKQLLFTTQKSIQEISKNVGYMNYISFNRSFKNVVGISPRDFRKQVTHLNP